MIRNSGATLEPAMIKRGDNCEAQGMKMLQYPTIFAPVFGWAPRMPNAARGYIMPLMGERAVGDAATLQQAFTKLSALWYAGMSPDNQLSRDEHHTRAIVPLASDGLMRPLVDWYYRARPYDGTKANAVHGDATLENIMVFNGTAVWVDPSTRPMPLEIEFDVAKILQTQFGYNECRAEPAVTDFVRSLNLRKEVLGYYLMTHLVRLYKVQPQARAWALDVAATLDRRLEEELCK